MTILDCCISLKMIKKILVVLGVVDMRQLLSKLQLNGGPKVSVLHCMLKDHTTLKKILLV